MAEKKKGGQYQGYATNIRLKDWAVVLCKTDYADDANPKILEKIIGDALELYFRVKACAPDVQTKIALAIAADKKVVANDKK